MNLEILVIADEIRSGVMVDGNGAYIARKLNEKGIEVNDASMPPNCKGMMVCTSNWCIGSTPRPPPP